MQVAVLFAAFAAAHCSLLAPAVYGHGLAIKAPEAPILTAGPLLSKSYVGAAPLAYAPYAKAPLAYAPYAKAPLAYAPLAKAPVAYTTTYTHTAPVLSHTGLLGYKAPLAYAPYAKAPLAYTPLAKAPLAYATVAKAPVAYTTTYSHAAPVLSHTGLLGAAPLAYGYGLAGHAVPYGHGLAYGHGLSYGHGLAYGAGYGKVLL